MTANNVIQFPKKPPKTIEEVDKSFNNNVPEITPEELTLELTDILLTELHLAGYDVEVLTDFYLKDIGLMAETIRSIQARYNQQPHFLHKVADKIFDETGKGVVFTALENDDVVITQHNGNN